MSLVRNHSVPEVLFFVDTVTGSPYAFVCSAMPRRLRTACAAYVRHACSTSLVAAYVMIAWCGGLAATSEYVRRRPSVAASFCHIDVSIDVACVLGRCSEYIASVGRCPTFCDLRNAFYLCRRGDP